MLRAALALLVGMVLGHALPAALPWLVAALVLAVVAIALWRFMVWQSVAVTLLWLVLGGYQMARSVSQPQPALPTGDVAYEAVLTSEPVWQGKVLRADMVILDGATTIKTKASFFCDSVDTRWKALRVGMGIRARSLLTAPANYRDGTFDYAAYLRQHGYRACTFIYIRNWVEAEVSLTSLSALDRTVLLAKMWRHRLVERLSALGMEGQDYAVIAALTLGEKSFLSKELKDDYSVSGASHVLALSGLHLGIIYGLLTFLFFGWKKQWAAQLFVMTLIWAYVVLVGFSPSVVRSATMLTVYAVVSLLQRDRFSLNTIGLVAVVMLCINPQNLYDLGFQMSFLAVLGILLFFPLFDRMVSRPYLQRHRVLSWLWGMVAVSLSAQLLIFPLVAYHFGRFSCYFLLSNFIAIPCATVLLYGIVLLVPVSFLPLLGGWLATALAFVARMMNAGLQWVASLPGASIEGIAWSAAQTWAVYVLLACFYYVWWFLLRHHILGEKWF